MPRLFFHIAYNGTPYHGWQIQPNSSSVQGEITDALTRLNGNEPIEIVGCGRTDTGVHASCYYFHADLSILSPKELKFKLNKMLPESIVVYNVFPVSNELHARFDARWRTYRYFIHQEKNPFQQDKSWFFTPDLDMLVMNEAAEKLVGKHDFTSFAKLHTDVKTNICEVKYAKWTKVENEFYFEITANRFLRNMVRAIVGTLVDVGLKKMTPEEFISVMEQKNRQEASISAPACGLFLWDVVYDDLMK